MAEQNPTGRNDLYEKSTKLDWLSFRNSTGDLRVVTAPSVIRMVLDGLGAAGIKTSRQPEANCSGVSETMIFLELVSTEKLPRPPSADQEYT